MLAPLQATNGTNALPSVTFGTDPDTGVYRIGANNLGITAGGTKIVDVATTGVTVTGTLSSTGGFSGPILVSDGSKTTPGLSFTSDLDTGLYRVGSNNPAMSAGDTKVQEWATTGSTFPLALAVTGAATTAAGLTATQSTSNGIGITSTGNGTGVGAKGTGGATDAAGVWGVGGATNGRGGLFGGTGTGEGLFSQGGSGNNAHGVSGKGGGAGGVGILGVGSDSGGAGGAFTAQGSSTGVSGQGGGTDGTGVSGTGGATNGKGGVFAGAGTGVGGSFANGTSATGGTRQDAVVCTNGDIDMSGVAEPTSTTSISNRLTPMNIPKVWGRLDITGGSGGGSFTIAVRSGFNITSVARVDVNTFSVTFGGDFANTDFMWMTNVDGLDAIHRTDVSAIAGGSINLILRNAAGTAVDLDASSANWTVQFLAFGEQ